MSSDEVAFIVDDQDFFAAGHVSLHGCGGNSQDGWHEDTS